MAGPLLDRSDVLLPLAYPGQRIGLMGGSFDPPHAAHAFVATSALVRLNLDRVWWLVTPGNPLKTGGNRLPFATRMALARAAVPGPRVEVTGFEAALGTTFTADTLAFLVRRLPAMRFVWLMGADNLAEFHRWRRWREIATLVPIAIFDRPGWRYRALASPAAHALRRYRIGEVEARRLARLRPPAWVFIGSRLSALSSTALRSEASVLCLPRRTSHRQDAGAC